MDLIRNKKMDTRLCCGIFLLLIATGVFTGGCNAVCQSTSSGNMSSDCSLAELRSETAVKKVNLTDFSSHKRKNKSSQTEIGFEKTENRTILIELNSKKSDRRASLTELKSGNSNKSFLIDLSSKKTLSDAFEISTVASVILNPVESTRSTPSALVNWTDIVKETQADMLATVAAVVQRDDHDDYINKVVGIAVPFTCVIFSAGLLFVTCKLCQKYRCGNNHTSLRRCRLFCDNCVSTRQVLQENLNQKPSYSIPSAKLSTFSFRSVSSTTSSTGTSSSFANYSQNRPLRSCNNVFIPGKYLNKSPPRHSSAALSVDYTSGCRKLSPYSSFSLSPGHTSSVRPKPPTVQNFGRLSNHKARLPRQTVGSGSLALCKPQQSCRSVYAPLPGQSLQ